MRITLLVLATTLAAAVLLPVAALADGAPSPADAARQYCAGLSPTALAATYGSKPNAMGKCTSANAGKGAADVDNAANKCKTEQAANPAAFLTKWGTNGKDGSKGAGKNAFGKCVSATAKQAIEAQDAGTNAAAAKCKAALKSDAAAFANLWGSKKNALGKCIAASAKTK